MHDAALATNRRNLLAGGGLLAAAASLPAIASTATAAHPRAWVQLVAAYRGRRATYDAMTADHSKREAELFSTRPPAPRPPEIDGNVTKHMTLAQIMAIPMDDDFRAYEAEKAAWEVHCTELQERIIGTSEDDQHEALEATDRVLTAIKSYPAPTFALLIEKLDLLATEYDGQPDEFADAIFADVRRLAQAGETHHG